MFLIDEILQGWAGIKEADMKLIIPIVLLTSSAAADITSLGITRITRGAVQARSDGQTVNDEIETASSNKFGSFVEGGSAFGETDDQAARAEIVVQQDTDAALNLVRGSVVTNIGVEAQDAGEAFASGNSSVFYDFEIDQSAEFFLRGSFIQENQTGSTPNRSSVRLVSFVEEVESIFFADPDQQDFSFNGELLAGRYKIQIETHLSAAADNANGLMASNDMSIHFRFGVIECAADIDGDGDIDAEDFFGFLDLFASGDGRADIDGDGDLDAGDFFAYLDLFSAGCP